ncbi:MAG: phospholipase/Carboxylesterase [Polaromonas sp.]|nr:phospholipase/Carboxylesterase [Polaromonas sp.]
MPTPSPDIVETIDLLSAAASPKPLFVLLHDAGGSAVDMLELGNFLGDAFAEAAVVMPEGLSGPADAGPPGQADALAPRVERLAAFIRAQQQRFNSLQSDTALVGHGAGATLALALSAAHDGLVGRVLAFGGHYAIWPAAAPTLTTLHLLHGQNDRVAPVARVRQDFAHLMELGADATLDVASSLGHELHPALMEQAVTRLQTCVPLRFWKAL